MSHALLRTAVAASVGAGTVAAALGVARPAAAADADPCGAQIRVSWSSQPVQGCPLTAPLSGGEIPVYGRPLANPAGGEPPTPPGWLHSTSGESFVCQAQFSGDEYVHPDNGMRSDWWAYTLSDDNTWGWVPEVFFAGGDENEADGGLRACPAPPPPPTTTTVTTPTVPTPTTPTTAPTPAPSPPRSRGGRPTPIRLRLAPPSHRSRQKARVWAGSSRRHLRDGETLVVRGHLLSHPRAGGVVVALQALYPHGVWRSFGITLTRRHGTFIYRYRFTRTTGTQAYRLRVAVPRQRGYPLRTGVSRTMRIVVDGRRRRQR